MDFDAIVIGSGQAGVPLATRLAGSGRKVLLAERGALGGTCVNTGCTPTKTLVASARAAHVARTARRLGVRVESVEVDFPAIIARKNGIVRSWQEGIVRRIADAGPNLRLVRAQARLVGERIVEAGGERHRAATVILNVGARPIEPPIPGLAAVPWLDNRRVMELEELPSHLVVIGGGYIGCEFAQAFRRFGSAVTIVEPGSHLLGQRGRTGLRGDRARLPRRGHRAPPRRSRRAGLRRGGARRGPALERRRGGGLPPPRRHRTPAQHRRSRRRRRPREARPARVHRGGRPLPHERARRLRGGRLHGGPAVHAHLVGRPSAPVRGPRRQARPRPEGPAHPLHGVHGPAGRGRGAHGARGEGRRASGTRSRPCRSPASRARSRPTRRRVS